MWRVGVVWGVCVIPRRYPLLLQVPLHHPHRDRHQAGRVRDADTLCRVHRSGQLT